MMPISPLRFDIDIMAIRYYGRHAAVATMLPCLLPPRCCHFRFDADYFSPLRYATPLLPCRHCCRMLPLMDHFFRC